MIVKEQKDIMFHGIAIDYEEAMKLKRNLLDFVERVSKGGHPEEVAILPGIVDLLIR